MSKRDFAQLEQDLDQAVSRPKETKDPSSGETCLWNYHSCYLKLIAFFLKCPTDSIGARLGHYPEAFIH
jgi:hypothetical protein